MEIKLIIELVDKYFLKVEEQKLMNKNNIKNKIEEIENNLEIKQFIKIIKDRNLLPFMIMVGLPGSGKTWNAYKIKEKTGKNIVSTDDMFSETMRKNDKHPISQAFINKFSNVIKYLETEGKTLNDGFAGEFPNEFRWFEECSFLFFLLNGYMKDKIVDAGGSIFLQPINIAIARLLNISIKNIHVNDDVRINQLVYDFLDKDKNRENYRSYVKRYLESKTIENVDGVTKNLQDTFRKYDKNNENMDKVDKTEIMNNFRKYLIDISDDFGMKILGDIFTAIGEMDEKQRYRLMFYGMVVGD